MSTHHLLLPPGFRAVAAILWDIFGGILLENGEIASRTEVIIRPLIGRLILGRSLDCFVLRKISNYVITLQDYSVAVHIHFFLKLLLPYPGTLIVRMQTFICAI